MGGLVAGFLAALLSLGAPAAPPAERTPTTPPDETHLSAPERRVRATSARIQELLVRGARQSPTFSALIDTLDRSDVIVYLELVPSLPGTVAGQLVRVLAAHGQCYVRIQVQPGLSSREAIAIIAHELRHAIEIADADVCSYDQMVGLYRRIGMPSATGHRYDTRAAQAAERQVRSELAD